jgi:diacylglycerol O-acyltransferase
MTAEGAVWPIRMNPTDALFWSMDRIPEMRSTVGALMILERAPSRERIYEEHERLSHEVPRMLQRVVEVPLGLAPPEWIEDPQFDLRYHVRRVAVPAPGGLEDVLAEISPLYATALDRDQPLWESYVIEGLAGGRGAVFVKMHHCVIDGVGGSRLFEKLMRERRLGAPATAAHDGDGRSTSATALLRRAAFYNLEEAAGASWTALQSLRTAASAPGTALEGIEHGFKMLRGFVRELVVMRAHSPLHQARSLSRQLSTLEMSLAKIDAVCSRFGATNNDIVLTIVSGAMRRWHGDRGAEVSQLRALVPVNIRALEENDAGNRLGLLAVALPVGERDPLRRLRAIQDRMGQSKGDRRAQLYPLLARVMAALPTAVAKEIGRQQTNRANFVCTNVPGPRRTCYFAGEAIEKIYPYAPMVGDHPVAIALYSYRDALCAGLDIDPLAMPDLSRFRGALQESYEEILRMGRRRPTVLPSRSPHRRRGAASSR